jgi:hypothetical protein
VRTCTHPRPRLPREFVAPAACLALCLLAAGPVNAGPTIGDVFYIELENHNFTQPSTDTTAPQQLLGNRPGITSRLPFAYDIRPSTWRGASGRRTWLPTEQPLNG